jgi:ABC-type Fe3+/spermidine/putrescine transport system ATPase subunit
MEVYDKPRTTFVAGFVGNSNLFQGMIRQSGSDQLWFESETLLLPLPPKFENQVGQRVNLLLRPEHLEIKSIESQASSESAGAMGEISFVTLLGLSIEYEVKLDSGAQLRLEVPRTRDQAPLREGSRVCVTPKDAASFLTIPTSEG